MTSDKSLRDFLNERKRHYVSRLLSRAKTLGLDKLENYINFVADEAYNSGRLADIEGFERLVDSKLTIGIRFGDLEEVVEQIPALRGVESAVAAPASKETADKKTIDYSTYRRLRDDGVSHNNILRDYSFKSPKQAVSFMGNYALHSLAGKPEVKVVTQPVSDDRPVLTYESYCQARDSGKTHEEAKTMFRPLKLKQIGPYSRAYRMRGERKIREAARQSEHARPSSPAEKPITPGLDYSLYVSRRESGKTDEEIMREFFVDTSNRRFQAFKLNYEQREFRKVKSQTIPKKKLLPRLTQYQYFQARMKGLSLEVIKSRFREVDESKLSDLEKHYQDQLRRARDEIIHPRSDDSESKPFSGGLL